MEEKNPWRFQGRRFDPESGLYHFRQRYLDPAQGRFVSRDPLGLWGDPGNLGSPYGYAGNDPVNSLDPFGLRGTPQATTFWGGVGEYFFGPSIKHRYRKRGPVTSGGGFVTPPRRTRKKKKAPARSLLNEVKVFGLLTTMTLVGGLAMPSSSVAFPIGQQAAARFGIVGSLAYFTTSPGFIPDEVGQVATSAFAGSGSPNPAQLTAGAVRPTLSSTLGRGISVRTPGGGITEVELVLDLFPNRRVVGRSPLAPEFYSVPNPAGGRVWVSARADVRAGDFRALLDPKRAGGDVYLLSGAHGTATGGTASFPWSYSIDAGIATRIGPRVHVINVIHEPSERIAEILLTEKRVVVGWCYGERSGLVVRALKGGAKK